MGRSLAPTRVWAMVQIPGEDKNTQNCQEDWPTRPRSRETRQNVVYNRYVGIFAMGAIGPELIFEGNAKSEKTLIRKQLRAITRHTLAVHNDSGKYIRETGVFSNQALHTTVTENPIFRSQNSKIETNLHCILFIF